MMKIAFFLPDLRGGGAERTVVNLLKEWAGRDLQLELVLVRATGVYLEEVPPSVKVVDLGRKRSAQALLPLVRYVKESKPDVLIAHLSHLNIITLLAKRLFFTGTRLVLVEHALLSPDLSAGKERIVRWWMKQLYPRASVLVGVSDAMSRNLEVSLGLPKGRVRTIYNPVVGSELAIKAKEEPSHPWLTDPAIPVVLGVGRLVPGKGWESLLEAFDLLRRRRPTRLIILGEGPQRADLEGMVRSLGIEALVSLPGFTGNPYAYMARCQVMVQSSEREALPGVVIEAMACGCPVVATDAPGGIREILTDPAVGKLVPVGDAAAMAEALFRVLGAPVDREELMESASRFSVERASLAYLDLLGEMGLGIAREMNLEVGREVRREAGREVDQSVGKVSSEKGESSNKGESSEGRELSNKRVVLHVITGLRTGGAEKMLCQLAAAMDRQRWEPVVICLTDGTNPEAWLREQGIPVYNLGMLPGQLPSVTIMLKLMRLVRQIRPALIHGWMYHGNLAASFARFFSSRRMPVLWSIHHSIGELAAEKPMTIRMIRLGARLSKQPDAIVYASAVSRAQHVALGYDDRKGVLIPYGVDPAIFIPSASARAAVRAELGLSPDGPVIGSLARYHPMKDHANLLRAAALLCGRPAGAGVCWVLAGTGVDTDNPELRDLINQLGIAGRVHLLGERADTSRLLAAMDIFCVSSSRGEALPVVLLEAMSCGVPAVTTDVGDAAQVVGDTGRVVPPRDPMALAAAWEELLTGRERRKALGEAARQKIITHYSLSVYAQKYEELYRSLRG